MANPFNRRSLSAKPLLVAKARARDKDVRSAGSIHDGTVGLLEQLQLNRR
jgi:hypothetical protein